MVFFKYNISCGNRSDIQHIFFFFIKRVLLEYLQQQQKSSLVAMLLSMSLEATL